MNKIDIIKIRERFQILSKMAHTLGWKMLTEDADHKGEGFYYRYSKNDLMNAILIFNHICSNYFLHNMIDDKVSLEPGTEKAMNFGKNLRQFLISNLNFDPHEYSKNK